MQERVFKTWFNAPGPVKRTRYGNLVSRRIWLGFAAMWCFSAASGLAQEESELAKQAQNPLARLISVPFQNNFNFDVGPKEDSQYVLNIQPVIPFQVSDKWNLITRTIVPIVRQPQLAPDLPDRTLGLGDTQLSLFLSPVGVGKVTWGAGPIFALPTATNDVLGTRKFSIGPSAVVIARAGRWVAGALVNNPVSVAGQARRRNVNQMLFQPLVNYNFSHGWYLTSSPAVTADWKASSDNRWTVPVGGGAGKVLHIGREPVNVQLQMFSNVLHPSGAPSWDIKFSVQLLLPKGREK